MARRKAPASPPETVRIDHEGKTYTGSYTVEGGMITVSYGDLRKTTQLGGSASHPTSLARLLLWEMVKGVEPR